MKKLKKIILITAIFLTNFIFAQTQFSHYYDASAANRAEFSYDVTVRIQKNDGSNSDAKRYTATLVQATPDPKGFYNANKDKNFYTCSQLGNVCNPGDFNSISVTIYYSCNGQQKVTSVGFGNLNEQQFIPLVLGAGGSFCQSIDFNSIKVNGAGLNPTHKEQIRVKIEQLNVVNSTSSSNSNNSETQTGFTNTDKNTGSTNTQTKNSYEPIPDSYKGNPLTYNSNNGSTALDSFNDNYQKGQQIVDVATGLIDLFSPSPEEKARKEREENLRIEREEAASLARANKIQMIASRKLLIKNYPDGKTPLSYQVKDATEVYYFVYTYSSTEIEIDNPKMYVSGVFPSPKYGDGTWAFKKNVLEKISKQNNNIALLLSGFYETKSEAEQKQNYFLNSAKNAGFKIINLTNTFTSTTNTNSTTDDFWEDKTTTNLKVEYDFWGNPIKN